MKIEAVFGGILALFVLAVAVYALATTSLGQRGQALPSTPGASAPAIQTVGADVECQCFQQGFDLAGSNVSVMSSQYRVGFEQCRAVGGSRGGDFWTAGWNARLSSKPYQASCRAYKRSLEG